MNTKYKYIVLLVLTNLMLFSCSDFLDENPDQRTAIDNKDKIRKLLVSAYPSNGFVAIAELSSDNVIDEGEKNPNNVPLFEEMAYWKDVKLTGNDDTKSLWESSYNAIANANLALEAIEKMEGTQNLKGEKAEALISRAYSYFVLVNVFAKHYNESTSNGDLGVPYIDKPETKLNPSYKRASVKEVYEKINSDIEAALPNIQDDIYEQPKYHFNKKAAYAFAARFNLYYGKWEKAKQYATKAIDISPLINWTALGALTFDFEVRGKALMKDPGVYLLQTDVSSVGALFGPYYYGSRINHTSEVASKETAGSEMPWGNLTTRSYKARPFAIRGNDNFKKFIFTKNPYLFEYTDIVAQIGYQRAVYNLFTTDETYLIRAEANIHLQKYEDALTDLNKWAKNFFSTATDVTKEGVNTFYNGIPYSDPQTRMTQKKKLNPVGFTIANAEQENMLHYVLQCRRILTLHEGLRWFDVKRYGIEVYRLKKQANNEFALVETLTKNDNRRAIQIPQDVVSSGIAPNPR